ncbi:MAG: hypothetical protein U9O94_05650 [Nanoarchaeota archaeon]|nr:hypothetical protein [Nanoarchaeota archaeon]
MVKIHGIVYIILSAGILYFSYRIGQQKFMLFILVGYLFLAVGMGKLVFGFINRKKDSPDKKTNVNEQQLGRMNTQQNVQNNSNNQGRGRYCHRCGAVLGGYENFCYGCGQRLR